MKKGIKLLRITTIPLSLSVLLKGQLKFLNQYLNVIGVCGDGIEVSDIEIREGVKVRKLPMEREIAPLKDIKSLRRLIQLFKNERPQIVHTNTPKSSLLSMIAAKLTGVPIRIYTVTGLRFEGFPKSAKRTLLVNMERITCRFATHVIPEGKGVKQALISNRITSKPLCIIANGNINGVDTSYFSSAIYTTEVKKKLQLGLGLKPNDFVYCFVGRLVTDKGIEELVDAFKQVHRRNQNVKLLFVGPFEDVGNALPITVKQLIEEDPAIITTGFVQDVRPYLAISHVFVFPSYREGFPNVVLQAGAMDLPCIVTNINGSNEIIEEGINGSIVPVRDIDALYSSMIRIFEDEPYRNQLRNNSRRIIVEHYEQKMVWHAMLERYIEYLREAKIVKD